MNEKNKMNKNKFELQKTLLEEVKEGKIIFPTTEEILNKSLTEYEIKELKDPQTAFEYAARPIIQEIKKEYDIDYGIDKITEESEGEIMESNSINYKYRVLNSGNTSAKLFVTDKRFIEGAKGVVE